MEQLDKALIRQQQRLNPNILDPMRVYTLEDIKRLVAQLDPTKNPQQPEIPIGAVMDAMDDTTGKQQRYAVSATTRSKNKRDILIDGMNIIKNRISTEQEQKAGIIEINGIPMKTPVIGTSSQGKTWIDPLINQWLGGYRDGIYICWNLNDGFIYRYNIYEHKLTRVENQPTTASTI